MYQIENAQFRINTRDYLLNNMEMHPLWLNALKERHPEGDLTDVLKSLFKSTLLDACSPEKRTFTAVNKKFTFKSIGDVETLLTCVGKIFMCNIEMNGTTLYTTPENMMILNLKITENDIQVITLLPTLCGMPSENPIIQNELDLSSSDSEEEEEEVKPPASFLASTSNNLGSLLTNDDSTRPFTPPTGEQQCVFDEFFSTNPLVIVKEEPKDDPDYHPPIKPTKKEKNSRKRKKDSSGGATQEKNENKKKKLATRTDEEELLKILSNLEKMDMKETDMGLLAKHLDLHTQGTMKKTIEMMADNIPTIFDTFKIICKFTMTLKKMLNCIPYKIDEKTGEPIIQCSGCHLHCVGNWNLPNPAGRPLKDCATTTTDRK